MDETREIRCRFRCQACGHEWEALFEERVHVGRDGDEQDLFLSHGLPSPNPEHDTACPSCHDLRVRLLRETAKTV
jgi:Zn finger protein HypA/HybF involved in hydrogenase expression